MLAEAIREGMILLLDKTYQEVISCNLHKGSATTGMMVHVKLKNLTTGATTEHRWSPTDKVEEAPTDTKPMQFLYGEGDSLVFLDPQSFEQLTLDKRTMGPAVAYLKEEMLVPIVFHEEKALSVRFAKTIDMQVTSTGKGVRGQDTTFKPSTVENGMEILVPQFIETGDYIRVEVESGKYIERIKTDKLESKPPK
jgi:elongation factor P